MSLGHVLLQTTANHLRAYHEKTNSFVIAEKSGITACTVKTDILNKITECIVSSCSFNHESPQTLDCWNVEDESQFVVIHPHEVHVVRDSEVVKHKYQPEKLPILGCCSFQDYVVTISTSTYNVCNLANLKSYSYKIGEIKKCTSVVAGWNMKIEEEDSNSDKQIDVLFCDGNKVYHCVGNSVSVIDNGRVLSFCKTEFGYLAAFETNWRLSPMHLFGDQPIDLDSLEIPRNHRSSSEARLQLYGWKMELLDDKNLPGNNEPTLLVERCNVVCVSGFYKHVISIFHLKNGTISHKKDISIGVEFRCAGLAFMEQNLLVLRRRFDSDNILLTFPSKSGTIAGDASLELINLEEHIGNLFGKKRKHKRKCNRTYDNRWNQPGKGLLSYPKFIRDNITEEEIEQKAQEILEEYRSKPPRVGSFSDSELSEGTLEILADCKPRHPFIPIPVCDSSGEEESELIVPGKLVLPAFVAPDGQNTSSLISEICSETVMEDNKAKAGSKVLETTDKSKKSGCGNSSEIDKKLDKIINLLERQNLLLEMVARQSLIDRSV